MPSDSLITVPFGPFNGVTDTRNPALPMDGKLRFARNMIFSGVNKLTTRPGSAVALTLLDDQGTPANVTSVIAISTFLDGAVAVAHSTITQKVYLYRLVATMDNWYNSGGVLQNTLSPKPVGALWTGVTVPPDVLLTEGLGTLYIANTQAQDSTGVFYPTKTFVDPGTIGTLLANGTLGAAGADSAYFTVVIAFQQALWGFGYGTGNTPANAYRPELARYSPPSFGNLQLNDSIVIGDRVRSERERVIGAGVCGEALFAGGAKSLYQITGYGRQSWYVTPLDRSYGFVGPKCMAAAGDHLYYWSSLGPMRVAPGSAPEPLWDAVVAAVSTVSNQAKIVCSFDPDRNQVLWLYDSGSGVRTLCAFDVRRDAFLGPDGDLGLVFSCAATIEPIYKSTVTPPVGPSAPPTTVSTTSVDNVSAVATWANGDSAAQTEISYQPQSGGGWSVFSLLDPGTTYTTITGLSSSTAYQWRVRHLKNGVYSSYAGPNAASMFATASSGGGGGGGGTLTAPSGLTVIARAAPSKTFDLAWTNGDPAASTQIWRSSDGVTFTGAVQTASPGATGAAVLVSAYGTYWFKVKHVRSGFTDSAFSNAASDTVHS